MAKAIAEKAGTVPAATDQADDRSPIEILEQAFALARTFSMKREQTREQLQKKYMAADQMREAKGIARAMHDEAVRRWELGEVPDKFVELAKHRLQVATANLALCIDFNEVVGKLIDSCPDLQLRQEWQELRARKKNMIAKRSEPLEKIRQHEQNLGTLRNNLRVIEFDAKGATGDAKKFYNNEATRIQKLIAETEAQLKLDKEDLAKGEAGAKSVEEEREVLVHEMCCFGWDGSFE